MKTPTVLQTTIAWGDCDQAGFVSYPKYFYWMDSAFHGLLRSRGLSLRTLGEKFDAHLPLVEASARFTAPATYDDLLNVEAKIVHWGTKSFRVAYKGFRGEQAIFEGFEARVWALRGTATPVKTAPIPAAFKEALE